MSPIGRKAPISSAASSRQPAMSTASIDRSATGSSLSVVASQQQQEPVLKTHRPAWKRLTRTISHTFLGAKKSKKKQSAVSSSSPAVEVSLKEKQRQGDGIARVHSRMLAPMAPLSIGTTQQTESMSNNEEEAEEETGAYREAGACDEESDIVDSIENPRGCTPAQAVALVKTIPPDYPLIRYITESFLLLSSPSDQTPVDAVEWRLYVKCLELKKWTLAHTLAEKMQRRFACQQRSNSRMGKPTGIEEGEVSALARRRVHARDSASHVDEADERDVILDFLDACSA